MHWHKQCNQLFFELDEVYRLTLYKTWKDLYSSFQSRILLLVFMCDSHVKHKSVLSVNAYNCMCQPNEMVENNADHALIEGHKEANHNILHIFPQCTWESQSKVWHNAALCLKLLLFSFKKNERKKKTYGAKYINKNLKGSSFWTKPPTLSPVSWRSPTANLACGSSPRGAPRSASSTYSCRLPSRCTVLPATVAAASASQLAEHFIPGSSYCPHQSLWIVFLCSCDLPCFYTSTPPAWFWPAGSPAYFSTYLCTSQNIPLSPMNSHNVHKLLLFVMCYNEIRTW